MRGAHSVGNVADSTIKAPLQDQEAALGMVFDHVRDGRPLTTSAIKEWHALLTRHQNTATGIDPFGNRVEMPLVKSQWKVRPSSTIRGGLRHAAPGAGEGSRPMRFARIGRSPRLQRVHALLSDGAGERCREVPGRFRLRPASPIPADSPGPGAGRQMTGGLNSPVRHLDLTPCHSGRPRVSAGTRGTFEIPY